MKSKNECDWFDHRLDIFLKPFYIRIHLVIIERDFFDRRNVFFFLFIIYSHANFIKNRSPLELSLDAFIFYSMSFEEKKISRSTQKKKSRSNSRTDLKFRLRKSNKIDKIKLKLFKKNQCEFEKVLFVDRNFIILCLPVNLSSLWNLHQSVDAFLQ